jgi:dolichol kinase
MWDLTLSQLHPSTSLSSVFIGVLIVGLVLLLQLVVSRPSILSHYPSLHLHRRVQHLLTSLTLLYLSSHLPLHLSLSLLTSSLLLLLLLHLLRLTFPSLNSLYLTHFSTLLRPHELHSLPSAFYLLLSFLTCLSLPLLSSLFHPSLATLSLLYEAIGDPIAGLVGGLVGGRVGGKANGKTWQGSAAMWLTCMLITATAGWSWPVGVIGPLVATVVERWSGKGLFDDNFMVPVITLVVLSALHSAGQLSVK